jgi:hypothetical protein
VLHVSCGAGVVVENTVDPIAAVEVSGVVVDGVIALLAVEGAVVFEDIVVASAALESA